MLGGFRLWLALDHVVHAAGAQRTLSHVMTDRFLTREQVAEELGVSPWVVYSLIRRRRLRAIGIGARGW